MTKQTLKRKKPTKAQLRRKVLELEANLAHSYHFANATIHRTSTDHLFGSGVLLQLSFLGGKEAFSPVLILDGLSPETITALKADIARSYERATELKP